MTKKQKKARTKIIAAALCMAAVWLAGKLFPGLGSWVNYAYLIPYLIVGYDVLAEAAEGIRNGDVFDENFLMAVATVGAIALGEFREGVAVMFFYQVGELFQSYAVGKSRKSIADLMDIKPETANLIHEDGTVTEEDPDDVPEGSLILIRPGEKVPIDGVIEEGESVLDTAALTGESKPVRALAGDSVISGSVNTSGVLEVLRGFHSRKNPGTGRKLKHEKSADGSVYHTIRAILYAGGLLLRGSPGTDPFADHRRLAYLGLPGSYFPGHQLPLRAGHQYPSVILRRDWRCVKERDPGKRRQRSGGSLETGVPAPR